MQEEIRYLTGLEEICSSRTEAAEEEDAVMKEEILDGVAADAAVPVKVEEVGAAEEEGAEVDAVVNDPVHWRI